MKKIMPWLLHSAIAGTTYGKTHTGYCNVPCPHATLKKLRLQANTLLSIPAHKISTSFCDAAGTEIVHSHCRMQGMAF
jgi:hypothetical protein